MLLESLKETWRNRTIILIYLLCFTILNAAYEYGQVFVAENYPSDPATFPLVLLLLSMDVLLVAVAAGIHAVGWSRLGKSVDRPLWKISGDKEALTRFFMLWFVLNLLQVTTLRLLEKAQLANPDSLVVGPLQFIFLGLFVFSVPIGACVMFSQQLTWNRMIENIQPLLAHFSKTLGVLMLNFIQFILFLTLGQLLSEFPALKSIPGLSLLLYLPLHFMDCLAFIWVWLICIQHLLSFCEKRK